MPLPPAAARPAPLPLDATALPPPRHVAIDPAPPRLGERITRLANVAVDAPQARVVALAAGGLTGGLMAMANATAPLSGSIVGALLGEAYLRIARQGAEDAQAHQRRWDMLHSTAALRDMAITSGLNHADVARVRGIHDHLQASMQQMIDGYRAHAAAVDLPVAPPLEAGLKAFVLEACLDHPPCVITCRETGHHYIAAVAAADVMRLRRQINDEGRPPGAVLRNLRSTFFCVDPAAPGPAGTGQMDVDRHGGQWQLRPARPVVEGAAAAPRVVDAATPPPDWTRAPAPMVQLRRRTPAAAPAPRPAVVPMRTSAPAQPIDVQRGPTLQEQCARLPAGSSTLKRIERVEQDLAAGRLQGHVVKQDGHVFIATDANIEGLAGRGRWRLLCRPLGAGYELVGIADYHDRRFDWWTG
ncbi:hypothetical protein [Stenotrophomonas sp.]|uniref:hypothetical protein n=1 Tax=Stenotrophomonas sp. TaxID=69392 RepID=UPI002FC62763